jgi:hypothetical protein
MPITIRHGEGDISALAQLALLSGFMGAKTPQAPAISPMGLPSGGGGGGGIRRGGRGMSSRDIFAKQAAELQGKKDLAQMEIDARAERDKQGVSDAADLEAVKAGLTEEIKLQEFQQEKELIHERAKADAERIDYKFTDEQRREKARVENAKNAIKRAVADGAFTPEQGMAAWQKVVQIETGIGTPSASFADLDAPPPPQELPFVEQTSGAIMTPDGRGGLRTNVPYKETKEGLRIVAQTELQSRMIENRQKARDAYIADIMKPNAFGEKMEPKAIRAAIKDYDKIMAEQDGAQQPEPAEAPAAAAPMQERAEPTWYEAFEQQTGIEVKQWQRELDPRLGSMLAKWDEFRRRFKNVSDVPKEYRNEYKEVLKVAEEYYAKPR